MNNDSAFKRKQTNNYQSPGKTLNLTEQSTLPYNRLQSQKIADNFEADSPMIPKIKGIKSSEDSLMMPTPVHEVDRQLVTRLDSFRGTVFATSDKPDESSDFTLINNNAFGEDQDGIDKYKPKVPISLMANDRQKEAIDQIVLEVSRTYRKKIIDLIPKLVKNCKFKDIDDIFDSSLIADEFANIAHDEGDIDFLQKFAYSQTFYFLLENYISFQEKNQITKDSDFMNQNSAFHART